MMKKNMKNLTNKRQIDYEIEKSYNFKNYINYICTGYYYTDPYFAYMDFYREMGMAGLMAAGIFYPCIR